MNSSPANGPLGFEALFRGSPATHRASSPIASAFPLYDPNESPMNFKGRTPAPRSRTHSNNPFLAASPAPIHSRSNSHNSQLSIQPTAFLSSIGTAAVFGNTMTMSEGPVTVVESGSAWDDSTQGFEVANEGIDLGHYDEHMTYGSPYKAVSNNATPTRIRQLSHQTTPIQSPILHSAPSSMSKRNRSVTGLGTPSGVHRSAKRMRQATYNVMSHPPSPTVQRRRVDPNGALLTSQPLSRAVSSTSATGSYLQAPAYHQDRVVSNASNMTASTSYEIHSPSMPSYHHLGMPPSFSLPELMGSQHPSPNISIGRSPIITPQEPSTAFYSSPTEDQAAFQFASQQSTNMIEQVDHFGGMGSVPGSTSVQSVSSFQGPGMPHNFRHGTLDTIVETPVMNQDGSMSYQQGFNTAQYDHSQQYQPFIQNTVTAGVDVRTWSAQIHNVNVGMNIQQQGYYGPSQVMHPGPPQRHASATFLNYRPNHMAPPRPYLGMNNRSVSDSHIPNMAGLPTSVDTVGLFQVGADNGAMSRVSSYDGSNGPPPAYNIGHQLSSAANSTTTSPGTPRKRAYPNVGTRMRPGPVPRLTPKKVGKKRSSSPDVTGPRFDLPIQGQLQVQISGSSGGSEERGGMGSINPSMIMGASASGILHDVAEEDDLSTPGDSPAPSKREIIEFGPELSTQPNPEMLLTLQQRQQPQLVIQPPRSTNQNSSGTPVSGLPRDFLEKLYSTFTVQDTSTNNQAVKRFKCLIEGCERQFPRKSAIHSHIQTHLEDKPFVCSHADCRAAFVRQHDLRRHTRIHSGTKPFPCPW
jgi:hypothetical protein